jgi:hypothetical protein
VPKPYRLVTTDHARVALERTPDKLHIALRVNETKPKPIPDLRNAEIDLVWSAGKSDFIVMHGATAECPKASSLAIIAQGSVSFHALGPCGSDFVMTEHGDSLFIRRIPPDGYSSTVAYRDGDLDGPYPVVARRETRAASRAVTPRRAESAQETRPESEADVSRLLPEATPDVPAVSARVGEDVVPAPVGAGPLPPGAAPLVPPFSPASQASDGRTPAH